MKIEEGEDCLSKLRQALLIALNAAAIQRLLKGVDSQLRYSQGENLAQLATLAEALIRNPSFVNFHLNIRLKALPFKTPRLSRVWQDKDTIYLAISILAKDDISMGSRAYICPYNVYFIKIFLGRRRHKLRTEGL